MPKAIIKDIYGIRTGSIQYEDPKEPDDVGLYEPTVTKIMRITFEAIIGLFFYTVIFCFVRSLFFSLN